MIQESRFLIGAQLQIREENVSPHLVHVFEKWKAQQDFAKEENEFDYWLNKYALRSPRCLRFADVYTSLFRRSHILRTKLGAVMAIVECDANAMRILNPRQGNSRFINLVTMGIELLLYFYTAISSMIIIPIAFLMQKHWAKRKSLN